MRTNKGFAALEALLIVVVIGLVGFVGYRVYQAKQTKPITSATTPAAVAPTINKTADLDKASQALDNTNLNTLDTYNTQLGSQSNF